MIKTSASLNQIRFSVVSTNQNSFPPFSNPRLCSSSQPLRITYNNQINQPIYQLQHIVQCAINESKAEIKLSVLGRLFGTLQSMIIG